MCGIINSYMEISIYIWLYWYGRAPGGLFFLADFTGNFQILWWNFSFFSDWIDKNGRFDWFSWESVHFFWNNNDLAGNLFIILKRQNFSALFRSVLFFVIQPEWWTMVNWFKNEEMAKYGEWTPQLSLVLFGGFKWKIMAPNGDFFIGKLIDKWCFFFQRTMID